MLRSRNAFIHAVFLAISVSGCNDSVPLSPTVLPSATPAAPVRPQTVERLRLTGYVRDDQDAPVGGASVKVMGAESSPPVVTDAQGFYDTWAIVDTASVVVAPIAWVSIQKAGYESVDNVALFSGRRDKAADFLIFRQAIIAAGEQRVLRIAFEGPLCGLESEFPCRRVTVTTPSSGTLVVETVGDPASERFPFGPVMYPFRGGVTRLSMAVRSGQIVPVEILWEWSGTGRTPNRSTTVTLRTALEP